MRPVLGRVWVSRSNPSASGWCFEWGICCSFTGMDYGFVVALKRGQLSGISAASSLRSSNGQSWQAGDCHYYYIPFAFHFTTSHLWVNIVAVQGHAFPRLHPLYSGSLPPHWLTTMGWQRVLPEMIRHSGQLFVILFHLQTHCLSILLN